MICWWRPTYILILVLVLRKNTERWHIGFGILHFVLRVAMQTTQRQTIRASLFAASMPKIAVLNCNRNRQYVPFGQPKWMNHYYACKGTCCCLSPQPPAEVHSNEITNKYETFNILFSKTMRYYSVPDDVLVVAIALIESALPREAASSAASSKFKF